MLTNGFTDLLPNLWSGRMLRNAVEGASRLGTPFVVMDIGQLESGEWTIIEPGDAQFAGYSKIPLLPLWSAISRIDE